MILKLITEEMQMQPSIKQDDIERSHRVRPMMDKNNTENPIDHRLIQELENGRLSV